MNKINYMFLIEVHGAPADKVSSDIMNKISDVSVGALGTDLITVISHSVSTDAEAAVAETCNLFGIERGVGFAYIHEDEVVAGTVVFIEVEGHGR